MTLKDTGPSILVALPVAASIRVASSERIVSADRNSGRAARPAKIRTTTAIAAKISFFRARLRIEALVSRIRHSYQFEAGIVRMSDSKGH
jgi:hypothetical protein